MSDWTVSDYAAWWGAIVATIAVGWNIIAALLAGPRVRVSANTDMEIIPGTAETQGKTFVFVKAVNVGNRATTITHMCGFHSSNVFTRFIKKKRKQFAGNAAPSAGDNLPHTLQPGEQWSNAFDQDVLANKFPQGVLYVGVIHNQRKRPVYVRIVLK